jgi:hypothetical protein
MVGEESKMKSEMFHERGGVRSGSVRCVRVAVAIIMAL